MGKKKKQKRNTRVVSLLLAGILFSESFFVQNGFSITTRAAEVFGTEAQENVPEELIPSKPPEESEIRNCRKNLRGRNNRITR